MLVAGACGDSGERSYGGISPVQVRIGAFHASQVRQFNRAVADYNGAVVGWEQRTPTCQRATKRLLARDAGPARQVRCHRENAVVVVDAVAELRRVVATFDGGEWSPDCSRSMRALRGFLVRFDAAWRRVLTDWNALARGQSADLDEHVETARAMAAGFGALQLAPVHDDCMTERDAADGLAMAAKAADDAG